MEQLILRQAAIDAISTWDKFGVDERGRIVRWRDGLEPYVKLRDVITAIVNTPSEHPERKKGKWIHISEEMWKCDQCGEISCCSPNFCPDCGSDNRERGNNE